MERGERALASENNKKYIEQVKVDFAQLKEEYPFATLVIVPTVEISPAIITVTAANKNLIEMMLANQSDFQGEYSRDLRIIVPFDYQENGCYIYGGRWIKTECIENNELHFHGKTEDGLLKFCVGVPESFRYMENVILENVRTAENMLIAYEELQKGLTKSINLKAYSHGDRGKYEYKRDKRKYRTKN